MRSPARLRAPLLLLLLLPGAGSAAAQIDGPVRTTGGLVAPAPSENASLREFRGIPYAAPPVGELRWREPQPAATWTGVWTADRFAPACIQRLTRSRPPWTEEFMHQGEANEDCLYLNVWTAARSPEEHRPVLVFLHGGGFNEGSGSVPIYDGGALARRGLVVVTLNYRLGALGFLAHPELTAESPHHASGDYGLLDQIAALRWVRENIAAFGGDPERVALAGQSAGAMSVYLLTASPLAAGLFQRAIVESGPGALASFGVASQVRMAR
jgi:para-nitrobenzyl esterase